MRDEPRGAGTSGGMLFLAVVAFLGYLAVAELDGPLRWLTLVVAVVTIIVLGRRVLGRR